MVEVQGEVRPGAQREQSALLAISTLDRHKGARTRYEAVRVTFAKSLTVRTPYLTRRTQATEPDLETPVDRAGTIRFRSTAASEGMRSRGK